MRKTWIIAMAAAAVALAGCNREAEAPAPEAGVFRATIETPSRVAFSDEGAFSWQEGDAIAVSTNAGFKTFTLASGAGSASGTFQGELVNVTSATVAIYPSSVAKDDATVTLPAEYAWKEGQSNAVMFCSQVSLTEVNSFKHLGGIIKITYSEIPSDANALVLKAEAKVTGDFAIADGKIAAGAGTDEVNVTFTAGSNPAAFYIPVPTGEYKFSVELQKDGATVEGTKIATTNPIKVERKSLILMDPISGVQAGPTIRDFAEEYVKILDVWEATTGEIVMHKDVPEETVANAHYVPETTTITVGGKEYNTADMFETALRSYLLIRGYNGLETEKYGKNSIPALEGGAVAMSTTEVPETHGYTWGEWPYNETSGNGGHLVLGTKDENEHCKVKTDILDNWAMRSLNFQKGKPVTNLCGYSGGQLPGYYGCFCSKRALLTYAFFFKHMLDNNLDKGTEVADDVIIRSELLGDEGPAAPELKMEIATAEEFLAFVENGKFYAATDEVKLTENIELPSSFVPDTLWCSFDGQGHTITYTLASSTSLKDVPAAADLGLFRVVNGTVKDLKVAGELSCDAEAGSGTYHMGGIAGMSGENAVFDNCESFVHVLATTKLTHHMGGIVGFSSTGTEFKNCRNAGKVEMILEGTSNASQIAGIVGHLDHSATLDHCVNDADLTFIGNGTARIAGMAGYLFGPESISFKDCVNNGKIFARGFKKDQYTYAGGISGYFQGGTAGVTKVVYENCINNGAIALEMNGGTTACSRAGGIAGLAGSNAETSFVNCQNYGEVSSDCTTTKTVVGGIISFGEQTDNITLSGCKNAGAVKAPAYSGGIVGGIIGQTLSAESTFTDVEVAEGSDLTIGSGCIGAVIGKAQNLATALTGKVTGITLVSGETTTVLTAENYKDFVVGFALAEGGSSEGVVFDGGAPASYPAPMEKVSEGAQLDPTTLPGSWNVLGNNSTKNGIYVLGGTGSDPRLVCPYDKTWDWNDSVYRESDNGLTIGMTGISGTSIQGTMNWWSGADGKFWDYKWAFQSADKPEYIPYYGTDLSNFYDKLPKGSNNVSIDIMSFTATLSNGETPKILTPGVYKFCEGGSGQTLTVPDGCFALKFHLGNMQVQAGEWYGKDIDRFMFCPLEYIIIFEKEGGSVDPGEQGEAAPMELMTPGAALDISTLAGSWNVLGNNSTKNGIYVLGGSGSDPRLVCPYDKTWDWNDSVYRESDNGLSIAVTSMEGTSVTGTINWWSGADGKFWDYVWNFKSSADPTTYDPYMGTDLSKFYNKIPKGKYAFTLDLATMTATLNNGEKPKILTPGVYKICDGDGNSQKLTVPDGCFAMKFHLGNMHKEQNGAFYGKDIDRFMFYPLEYFIIFEKE